MVRGLYVACGNRPAAGSVPPDPLSPPPSPERHTHLDDTRLQRQYALGFLFVSARRVCGRRVLRPFELDLATLIRVEGSPVMNLKRYPILLALLCSLLLAAVPALAQFDTATVVGTVKDNTGGVVPGATVTLTNLDTGVALVRVTEANGSFEFITVRIGRYKVTAELEGFAIALADNIQVTVGARQRVDLQMSPGQLTETVEVVGAAAARDRLEPARPVITGRAGRGTAAERPRYSGLAC